MGGDIYFISEIPPVLRKIEFFLLRTSNISRRRAVLQSPEKAAIQQLPISKSKFYFYLVSAKIQLFLLTLCVTVVGVAFLRKCSPDICLSSLLNFWGFWSSKAGQCHQYCSSLTPDVKY